MHGRRIRVLQLDDAYDVQRAEENVRALNEDHKVFALVHLVGTAIVDKVLELIDTINRQGVTVFMVEQNASLALEIAHYGYVLQTGRVVLEGPAKTLLDDERVRDAYLGGEAVAA